MRRPAVLPLLLLALAGCPDDDDGGHPHGDSDTDAAETDGGDSDPGTDSEPGETDAAAPYDDACPEPQAVNTICADVEGYGARVFTVTSLNGGQALASAAARGGGNDGLNIQHTPANVDHVEEGTQDCAGLFFVNLYLADGHGGSTTYTTEVEGGACSLVTTTGGSWAHEPLAGTFTATVVSEDDGTRTISGSFSYDATAL